MFYHANTAGMGVESFFFIFVNKLIFSEALRFSAQQQGCVLKCITVSSLPHIYSKVVQKSGATATKKNPTPPKIL